jgi:hypothetical protein
LDLGCHVYVRKDEVDSVRELILRAEFEHTGPECEFGCVAPLPATCFDRLCTGARPGDCGDSQCADNEYCRIDISDVSGTPDVFTCVALPETCGNTASCACLSDEPCGDRCVDNGGRQILTCPGG